MQGIESNPVSTFLEGVLKKELPVYIVKVHPGIALRPFQPYRQNIAPLLFYHHKVSYLFSLPGSGHITDGTPGRIVIGHSRIAVTTQQGNGFLRYKSGISSEKIGEAAEFFNDIVFPGSSPEKSPVL